jgi:replicative DNA helicase
MVENEQNILGAILMDNNALDKVYDTIKPEMFESGLYGDIYRNMLAMYDRNEPIDIVNLSQALEDKERTRQFIDEQLGTIINKTFEEVFTTQKIKTYADVLVNDWRAREVTQLISRVDTTPKSINSTIGDIITSLEELQETRKNPLMSLKDIVNKRKDEYFKDNEGKNGVKTYFYKLDEHLISLEKSTLTIVAARPAVGKSVLGLQVAKENAKRGMKVAVFTMEMNDKELYERLLVSESDFELTRLKKAKEFLKGEKEQFIKANNKVENYPIYIASGDFSVNEIYRLCKHQNFDLIIIDYLQLLEPDKSYRGNRTAEVGEISRNLKKTAMKLKVPIIALSQLNRAVEGKKDKEPTMAELRESGSLEQDANNIIILWNLSEDNKMYKGVKVEKCRQGETGKVGMKFDGKHMTFTERIEDFYQWEKQAKSSSGFKPSDDFEDMFE